MAGRPSRSAVRGTEAMDKICIRGGVPLEGVIPIGGAKKRGIAADGGIVADSGNADLEKRACARRYRDNGKPLGSARGCGREGRGGLGIGAPSRIIGRTHHLEHGAL